MKQQLIIALLALGITFPLNIFSQDNFPSKTERIYSLSMIWKELEYNFAFHLISKAQIRQPVLRLFA